MRSLLALPAIAFLIVSAEAPLTRAAALAANARCAAGCDGWCTKNRPRMNLASCSEMCQAKHCH